MTNDSLGDLSLKPARDELAQRQTGKPKPTRPGTSPGAPRPPAARSSGQGLLWLVILLLLAGGAGGGWFLWHKIELLQSSLDASTNNLTNAESALSSLQQTLENRDNTLSKSGDQMETDIKKLDTEVRKLWTLANNRNRTDIEALEKQVKTMAGNLNSSATSVTSLSKNLDSTNTAVADLKKQITELKEGDTTLTSATAELKKEMTRMKSILGNAADFDDRITNLEVAIKSIDAYRSQINSKLERLDREVGALQIPAGT